MGSSHEYQAEVQCLHGVESDVPAELRVVRHPVDAKEDEQGGQGQP